MENKNQKHPGSFCCSRVSMRHILCVFTLLAVFAVYNLVSSSSQLSLAVDVTMKMKSNVLDALNNFMAYRGQKSLNGTFSMRSFANKTDFVVDYKKWLHRQANGSNITLNVKSLTIRNLTTSGSTSAVQPLIKIDGTKVGDADGKRADTCSGCFKHNFEYLIDNENICKPVSADQAIRVVIFITTIHGHVQNRNAIRQTWLTVTKNNTGEVRYAFLLGQIKDESLHKAVVEENNIYHDIIKEDFVDTYMNLTFKTIMAFKYATTRCTNAQYVMKTDDDMFVNIQNLLKLTETHKVALQRGIGGSCSLQASPIRDQRSKWFASVKSYPNSRYPGFCSGTGYVTSLEVARKVYEISPSVPFFHLEDVYASLCIRKLDLKLTRMPGFNIGKPHLDPCNYKNNVLVTAHGMSPDNQRHVWMGTCARQQPRRRAV